MFERGEVHHPRSFSLLESFMARLIADASHTPFDQLGRLYDKQVVERTYCGSEGLQAEPPLPIPPLPRIPSRSPLDCGCRSLKVS